MALHVSTVVVPIDFSIAAAGAIETALEIVDSPSQLHLIHVMLPLETMSPGVLLGDITDVSRTEKVTTALKKLAYDQGADGAHLAVTVGTPGLEIADYAKRHEADLILIPSCFVFVCFWSIQAHSWSKMHSKNMTMNVHICISGRS